MQVISGHAIPHHRNHTLNALCPRDYTAGATATCCSRRLTSYDHEGNHASMRQRFVLPLLINLFHGMSFVDALRREENVGENVITQNALGHQPLTPSAWLRGNAPKTWGLNERDIDRPVFQVYAPGNDNGSDMENASCIDISHNFRHLQFTQLDTARLRTSEDTTTSGTLSTNTSVRLNRFERHRDEVEDMQLLMIARQFKGQKNGELKFRTDFEACFKEFPLEHMYGPHWSCHSPVSAQTSVRSSRASSKQCKDTPRIVSTLSKKDGNPDDSEVYEYAKVKGVMNEIMLPRNLDGSPMAELDASSIQRDAGDSPDTLASSLLAPTVAEMPVILKPRLASDRLSKMLATLRPLSWAKRASIHLKHIRHSAILPDHSFDERELYDTEEQTTSKPIWRIRSTDNALAYTPAMLNVTIEDGGLEMPSSFSSPTELGLANKNPVMVLTSLPKSYDSDSESGGDDDSDDMSVPEMVAVEGCWIAIASHEQ
ncbi:hypothetical protein CERZMDRAFT_83781 [Cercospora zeae-maydis SCOH1-5]|uniref:Uncharacterized protein n=1 Tax=Cercospora zeae-maydis SCOH1-5 TaxID=717836 RepID=A0A6A6FJU7_9PEZI|nr:hypothetical protein CERZMDRAFT_83781 [Cercospora zeae-maydis SCOH1-5]